MHNDYFLNIQKPENEQPRAHAKHLSTTDQLDAITWAANRAGVSYGQFSSRLTEAEKETIYAEYQAWQAERQAEIRERMKNRARIDSESEE